MANVWRREVRVRNGRYSSNTRQLTLRVRGVHIFICIVLTLMSIMFRGLLQLMSTFLEIQFEPRSPLFGQEKTTIVADFFEEEDSPEEFFADGLYSGATPVVLYHVLRNVRT